MFESTGEGGKRGSRKFVWATTGTIAVAGVLVASYLIFNRDGEASIEKKKDQPKTAAPIPVEIAKAELGEVFSTLESFATLESEQQAEIFAKTDGQVTSMRVEEGDVVAQGALIAEIGPEDKAIQLETARLKAANARRELERAQATFARQMISEQEYEKLKSAADVSAMDLKEAEWRLANTRIIAPFSGKITERKIVVGRTVKPGEHLFTIASYNPLVAKVFLPQKDLASIRLGQKALLAPESAPSDKWQAEVYRISPVIDAKTGTVKVTLKLVPQAGQIEQRPGTYVRVQIQTATRAEAVLIPKQAIFEEDQKTYVFVAKEKRAEKREVAVGYASNGNREILKGISAGESVVTMGMASLKENSELDVTNAAARSASHETR